MSATAASVSAAQQTQKEMGNSAHADSMNVRSHLLKAGASLMALLFVSTVAPVTLHSMQFRGTVRKLSAKPEDVSNHSAFGFLFELNGTEDRQQGIYRPELPRYPVSTMQVCNYGRERVTPRFGQLDGRPGAWSITGTWIPTNRCYILAAVVFKSAVEDVSIDCLYLPEGAGWTPDAWARCGGGELVYQRNSVYSGQYSCTGSPVQCVYNGVFIYRRR